MTDQSVSSCSSNPSTPMSSPPPLPGASNSTSCHWSNNGSTSHYSFLPHFPTDRAPNQSSVSTNRIFSYAVMLSLLQNLQFRHKYK